MSEDLIKKEELQDYHPETMFSTPGDEKIEPISVHFVTMRVSKYRSVIAKYAGHAAIGCHPSETIIRPLSFEIISGPLSHLQADEEAYRLQNERAAQLAEWRKK